MVANKGLEVVVKSPSGAGDAVFFWHDDEYMNENDFDENMEIVDSIKWIVSDIPELLTDSDMVKQFRMVDSYNFESVQNLVEIYNEKIEKIRDQWKSKSNMTPGFTLRRASRAHLKHILQQCYNRAVSDAEKLNQYLPFSPEVYGETSFELIYQMIQSVKISGEDNFIDLGSGVGQVVLQVAASTRVKSCVGIEKADYPAQCAESLEREFRFWMAFYGKPFQQFSLLKDDFLEDRNRDRITNATVIFANNFAFGPNVDHQLKLRFANLKEGARVISSKAFCPLNFRITDRNLSDIGSIMSVRSLNPLKGAVSWTDKPFSYFVHTIDRSLLEDYFAKLKNNQIKDGGNLSIKSRTGSSSLKTSNEGSSTEYDTADEDPMSSGLDRGGTDDSNSQFDLSSIKQQLILSTKTGGGGRTSRPNAPSAAVSNGRLCSLTAGGSTRVANTMNRIGRNGSAEGGTIGRLRRGMAAKNRRNRMLQENEGLQMLHASTVSSVESSSRAKMSDHDSTLYNSPAMLHFANVYQPRELRGVVEAKLSALDDTDHRLFQQNDVVPFALIQYLELIKQSFMTHFARMNSSDYRSKLEHDIAAQKAKNSQLKSCIHKIEESIDDQHREGKNLLNAFLKKVGIQVETPLQFFGEARKLIKNNHVLEVKIETIKKQIAQLQTENEKLNGEFVKLSSNDKFTQQQTSRISLQVSNEEQRRLIAEHVQQKLNSVDNQIRQHPNPKIDSLPSQLKVVSGGGSVTQVVGSISSSTPAIKKERKKSSQPRGQGSPKVKRYPGPGRPKKSPDEKSLFTIPPPSKKSLPPVASPKCSTAAIVNSTGLSLQDVKPSTFFSKNFINTSLEELIKQEIMRPVTPPTSRGNSSNRTELNFLPSTSAGLSQTVTHPVSRPTATVDSLLHSGQTFTLIPVTLCQSTSSSTTTNTQSIQHNPPQTQFTIMRSSQILNHSTSTPSNNSKPPILHPMNSISDLGDSSTAPVNNSSHPPRHSSSPAASLNSNPPRSVETLSAYSPVSRPSSIESGKTPPCQKSPAGSLCNLPLSNLPPRKRAHYENYTSDYVTGDSCSSPKIPLLNDAAAVKFSSGCNGVTIRKDSVIPQPLYNNDSTQQNQQSFTSPPILSNCLSSQSDLQIPASPPTLRAVDDDSSGLA